MEASPGRMQSEICDGDDILAPDVSADPDQFFAGDVHKLGIARGSGIPLCEQSAR